MDDDLGFSRRSVVAAVLVLGGVLAFLLLINALGPADAPARVAATAAPPGLRLHTPTPDPRHIAEQAYKIMVAREVENIAFEVNIIAAGVQLADPSSPSWRSTMTESAASLTAACDRLWVAVPPDNMRAVHGDVLKMADRFRTGARVLLRDGGFVDAKSLNVIAAQFEYGINFMARVADYFER